MAFGGHKASYCSSAKYAAVTAWATGVAKSVGNIVKQVSPATDSERVFVCIVAGTTHATTEPTWVLTAGAKTTDNTVTWQEITGIPALNGDLTNTPTWAESRAQSTSVTLGHVLKDNAGTHIFICTTAGSVGASEPSFSVGAVGNTTTDSSVTWTYLGTSFGAWAAPHDRLNKMFDLDRNASAVLTTYYVGHDHAPTRSTAYTQNSVGTYDFPLTVLSVNTAGSMPPVAADILAGASETTTGSAAFSLSGTWKEMYGITFHQGTGATSPFFQPDASGRYKKYKNCVFDFPCTGGASMAEGSSGYVEYDNCKIKFSGGSTTFNYFPQGRVRWLNSEVIDLTGAFPATFIKGSNKCDVTFRGCDLSGLSGKIFFDPASSGVASNVRVEDCIIPAAWTLQGGTAAGGANRVSVVRSGPTAISYRSEISDGISGSQFTNTDVVRTGGQQIASTSFAWRLVSTAASINLAAPFRTLSIAKHNPTIAANVTATIYGISNSAAMPTNQELWLDVDYLGDSGSPKSSQKSSKAATPLTTGAALTADSVSVWDSGATARANTHVYALGDALKVASNSGRVFFCSVAGTSAGSEPGGYASAVDGGTVTDGTATFRAGWRFSIAVVLTSPQPQIAGLLYGQMAMLKASTTVYIDPTLALS